MSEAMIATVDFELARTILGRLSHHVCVVWIKTIANGWTTSTRLHYTNVWACTFCKAEGQDAVAHYLNCPTLNGWIRESIVSPLSSDLRVLLALSPCDFLTLKNLFVRFTVYHSVRHSYIHTHSSPERWRAVCKNSIATASAKFELLTSRCSVFV